MSEIHSLSLSCVLQTYLSVIDYYVYIPNKLMEDNHYYFSGLIYHCTNLLFTCPEELIYMCKGNQFTPLDSSCLYLLQDARLLLNLTAFGISR